jgi:hypothetical protein
VYMYSSWNCYWLCDVRIVMRVAAFHKLSYFEMCEIPRDHRR